MRKSPLPVIGAGFTFAITLQIAPAPVPTEPPADYALVWSDEFSEQGRPNPQNWTFENGFVRNQELQWYQPQNAGVENGLLVIEARREGRANAGYEAGSSDWRRSRDAAEYTSASLTTRGLHAWQYGYFEMRARIDTRGGLWPAWWTLGTSGSWPHNGEIDIMEYYRGTLLANAAWGGASRGRPIWDDSRKPVATLPDADWSTKFHVWRMLWDERLIRLSMDDVWLNDIELERTVNQDGTAVNPMRRPHYMIVNLAVGGTSGGDPSATTFPGRYEIDYIRVYQRRARRDID
jgi:beta-glucanase (GH16 family)